MTPITLKFLLLIIIFLPRAVLFGKSSLAILAPKTVTGLFLSSSSLVNQRPLPFEGEVLLLGP